MAVLTDKQKLKLNQFSRKWGVWLGDILSNKELVTKTITVAAAATSGASAADTTIAGGTVIGIVPAGNQDQFVDNVAINATTGAVTVTLAAAATANNVFNVTVQKA
jgi:hypothetical protein